MLTWNRGSFYLEPFLAFVTAGNPIVVSDLPTDDPRLVRLTTSLLAVWYLVGTRDTYIS